MDDHDSRDYCDYSVTAVYSVTVVTVVTNVTVVTSVAVVTSVTARQLLCKVRFHF